MRAMVYRGPGRGRVEEKEIPAIEHPNDAIVKVTHAAICGSDLQLYHWRMPDLRVGHTFGHEFVVHEVVSSAQHLKVGDRVLVLESRAAAMLKEQPDNPRWRSTHGSSSTSSISPVSAVESA